MYCIKCGVKLSDTEKQCPLCETKVYHPDIVREAAQPLYPAGRFPVQQPRSLTAPIVLSTLFLMPLLITLLCDLKLNGAVTWSGYVTGALAVGYVLLAIPLWFKKPDPVICLLCDFTAVGLYLRYIEQATAGTWFWSLAFPLVGISGLIITLMVVLIRRFPRGGLYIFGGSAIALGLFMPVMEYLINLTFSLPGFAAWSMYPMVALVLLGLMLIFIAACSPARKVLERKLFL